MNNRGMRFPGMAESIGPMCHSDVNPWGVSRFPVGPLPGYRTRREEHALLIVPDEFRPAIPRRVARQQGPLLFHRQIQTKSIAVRLGIIYHRTVDCLLTFCLTRRSNRNFPDAIQVNLMLAAVAPSTGRSCTSLPSLKSLYIC
jgi:hypothetical protein